MANPVRHSRFRYLDADDLPDDIADLDGIDVRNAADEKLGEVDGFIVDAATERPYYVVVESGGWFSGGRYLLPINHSQLVHDAEDDEDVLRVNLDKDAIRRYPKFDKDSFARLSDTEREDFERRMGEACCADEARSAGPEWNYDRWSHYRQPEWWSARHSTLDRDINVVPGRGGARPISERRDRREPERIIAQEGRPAGDRAQPGDVLGIESEGEETHLGDTARDEERRVEVSDEEELKEERKDRRNERG